MQISATPRSTVRDIVPPSWHLVHSGKVRETFEVDDHPDVLYMVCTDRLSAFDVVSGQPIPGKGVVLNLMSAYWFGMTRGDVPNHFCRLLTESEAPHPDLAWRTSVVERVQPLMVEAVFRNRLAGSSWVEYREKGTVCGMKVKKGMEEGQTFTSPIYTPSTKAESNHDQNVHPTLVPGILKDRNGVSTYKGKTLNAWIRRFGLELMKRCSAYALKRGIAIADTKMEFGLKPGWESAPEHGLLKYLVLIDELLTPDSSRFWEAGYELGKSPPSYDKQFVRDYLSGFGWDRQAPMPVLPDWIIAETTERYLEALRRLTDIQLVLA